MDPSLQQQVKIYRPNQRHELGWLHTWVVMARNMVRSRELIWPVWQAIFLPVVALPLFFLGAGIGLIGSVIAVVAIDMTKLVMSTYLLMWTMPILNGRFAHL